MGEILRGRGDAKEWIDPFNFWIERVILGFYINKIIID
jgi:hypothetical protein